MRVLAIVLFLIGGAVAFAIWYMRPDVIRYRMTVEIDTPAGSKSGSAVQQLTLRREPRLTPESGGWSLGLEGEAVTVDVAPGKIIFALLKSRTGNYPWELLRHSIGWNEATVGLRTHLRQAERDHVSALLQPEGYPLFATFADPNVPSSVEVMDANEFHVRRITLTMTDEPVTTSLSSRLPWLSRVPERTLKQPVDPYDHSLAARLTHADFIREGK